MFTIKPGDLTRFDWNASAQAVRQSLEEILEVYIPNRLPDEYRNDPVVVCVVIGGAMSETVREIFTGFCRKHRSERVQFSEWNGERLAGMLMSGNHGESIIVRALRSPLQKSIAMVDFPDNSERHFKELASLIKNAADDDAGLIRAALQINVCAWMIYAWCRQSGNLESALRASEVSLITLWSLACKAEGGPVKGRMRQSFSRSVEMHLQVFETFFEGRIRPVMNSPDWLARAVGSRSPVDASLMGYRLLGRCAIAGLWRRWLEDEGRSVAGFRDAASYLTDVVDIWEQNPVLALPIADFQSASVGCVMLLSAACRNEDSRLATIVGEMIARLNFALVTRTRYPTVFTSYSDLAMHPRDKDDRYFERAGGGSTLVPLVALFCHARGLATELDMLSETIGKHWPKASLQLWMADTSSEDGLLQELDSHGKAMLIKYGAGLKSIQLQLAAVLRTNEDYSKLSMIAGSVSPLLALCCSRIGLPLPAQLIADI
ncbi:hypothetical protein JAK74_05170 [Stenotrophomonas maltophilia]|nr:hypothetical protein [Stenotrophomonas maltophilia]